MQHGRQIFFLLILFLSFNARAQIPVADISTTSESVILAGSTVQLDGTASTASLYHWKLIRTPMGSGAELTTPSPSMPSFTVDRPGLYLVELTVGDEDNLSEPEYLAVTAVTPAGDEALSSTTFSTPALCALLGGFTGCTGSTSTFAATPGDYTLNIRTDSLMELALVLNGEELPIPILSEGQDTFSVAVTLKDNNQLNVLPRGESGSFATVEIVESDLPGGMNTVPSVADLTLEADNSQRMASGILAIVDPDMGQTHTSEILSDTMSGTARMRGAIFDYEGNHGFKGTEKVSVLTYDDGDPIMATVSKVTVDVTYNTGPRLYGRGEVRIPKGSAEPYSFRLPQAHDAEGDALVYSLTHQITQGTLDCQNRENAFQCTYTPPENLDSSRGINFSYKANDGKQDSNSLYMTLTPVEEGVPIVQLEAGIGHNCALFSDGSARCWGGGGLGLGYSRYTDRIGDRDSPLLYNRFDIGESFIKLALGSGFSCGLTDSGKVRCWGSGSILGIYQSRHTRHPLALTPEEGIDFGTDLKVVDITSTSGSTCALFENGRVKCWGNGYSGQLGLGHSFSEVGGFGIRVHDTDFLRLGGRVLSLSGSNGNHRFCAILEEGSVRCWGGNFVSTSQKDQFIGDDEHPDSIEPIPLGEPAVQVATGYFHACALLSSGSVKCWGGNHNGQLGLGHRNSDSAGYERLASRIPIKFPEGTIDKVVAGSFFTCVLMKNRFVRCWGDNSQGQLGLGHRQIIGDDELPSSVPALSFPDKIVDLEAGRDHVCVLLEKGAVRCWGFNDGGQLGLGHSSNMGDNETSEYFRDADIEGFARIHPRMALSSVAPRVGEQITVSAQDSVFRGKKMSFAWDFGDGTTATGMDASHTFQAAGGYPVLLTLTDAEGESVSVTRLIRVRPDNYAPDMPRQQGFMVEKNKITTLHLAPATDYEGDEITYTLSGTEPVSGALSECLGGMNDLSCKYESPVNFTGTVTFAYGGHDGNSVSITDTKVEIQIVEEESVVVSVAMGENHSCALYENKKIKCWGRNTYGQLGLGHNENIGDDESLDGQPFVDVGGDVVQVAAGKNHTCAILEGGFLKCWGGAFNGALAGTLTNVSDPSTVPPLNFDFSIKQVSLGNDRGCVVSTDGRLVCWGYNQDGVLGLANRENLGDSSLETPDTFPFVKIGGKVAKVVVGPSLRICALLENGELRCWGNNGSGRYSGFLGLGSNYQNIPFVGDDEHPDSAPPVSLGKKVIDVSLGINYFCALLEDNNIRCWGLNPATDYLPSIVGNDEHPSEVPTVALGGLKVGGISLGPSHACAVLEDKTLKCWGFRRIAWGNPEFGSSSGLNYFNPVDIPVEAGEIVEVFSGLSQNNICIVLKSGSMHCWGPNDQGSLGLGHAEPIGDNEYIGNRYSLVARGGKTIIPRFNYSEDENTDKKINFNAGESFSRNDVQSYSWNFGDGTTATGENVSHTFGMQETYDVTLTVTDIFNQSETLTRTVRLVDLPDMIFLPKKTQSFPVVAGKKIKFELNGALHPDAGSFVYTLVSAPTTGTLGDCLGIDGTSELNCTYVAPSTADKVTFTYKAGNGAVDSNTVTVEMDVVEAHPVPVQISSYNNHTCALYENKKIKCWGGNAFGQLGLGHTNTIGDDELVTEQGFVDVGGDVLQVAVGSNFTCVLLSDQSVKCWGTTTGTGHSGETIGDNETPSAVTSLDLGEAVSQIVSGNYFACALTVSGRVKCWGDNSSGQLGRGHRNNVRTVSATEGFVRLGGRAIKIATSSAHTCALLKEGRLRCWGANSSRQLGHDHHNNIGDDEHPFMAGNVPLPKKAIDVSVGELTPVLSWRTTSLFAGGTIIPETWGFRPNGALTSVQLLLRSPPVWNWGRRKESSPGCTLQL